MQHMLDVMIRAALKGGDILKEARANGLEWVEEKGRNDYVTAADKESEAAIKSILAEGFPDIPLLAEEGSGTASGTEGRFFCVDPLDGTNNFVHGIPVYCVSVGLIEGGRPVLGAVYDPVHDELYTGGREIPAALNGKPMRTSGRPDMDGSFVATGFPFKELDHLEHYVAGFRKAVGSTGGLRRCGSAALDICWTAAGRFDGFWERGLWPWDVAAATSVLLAAGGGVMDFAGGEDFLFGRTIVCGATPVFTRALRDCVGEDFRGA
jgi:myo-inositol-1(or 4)-monophosphatase